MPAPVVRRLLDAARGPGTPPYTAGVPYASPDAATARAGAAFRPATSRRPSRPDATSENQAGGARSRREFSGPRYGEALWNTAT
ncbi:hypothetical protein SHL15_7073 [Streptomyces hygroscopicus subsp. limoneus]|nr:hypothetical protein SHL15_7073 [Streptomyces hygroscopicus subsp. limoneus]